MTFISKSATRLTGLLQYLVDPVFIPLVMLQFIKATDNFQERIRG